MPRSSPATQIPYLTLDRHLIDDGLIYRLLTWQESQPIAVRETIDNRYLYYQLRASLGTRQQFLYHIASRQTFVPYWQRIHQPARDAGGHRLSYLLTVAELNRADLVRIPPTLYYEYGRQTIENIRLLTLLMTDLIEQESLSQEDIITYLSPLQAIDQALFDTVTEAVRLYGKKDYLPAAYILTLQLEDLLRHLLRLAGQDSLEQTRNGLGEMPLGRILKALRTALTPNLYHHLVWVLSDYRGLNLRNAIAHGFFKKANTHPAIVIALLHLFILLAYWVAQQKETTRE